MCALPTATSCSAAIMCSSYPTLTARAVQDLVKVRISLVLAKEWRGKRIKKETWQRSHLTSYHHTAACMSHLTTSVCRGAFPFCRRQAAFTMATGLSSPSASSNESCFRQHCLHPNPQPAHSCHCWTQAEILLFKTRGVTATSWAFMSVE